MPLGYKYAERTADTQLNWFEIGQQASGMLAEVNRVREEKKDAIDKAYRESIDNLMNSPQGVDQSVNSTMNDFAHNLIEQKKIDYDLLKRGKMKLKDYTLKVQNQLDGTNNLFKVAPELQKAKKNIFDGIANGSLQTAANLFQGSFVEKMVDLSKLSINVNSPDGTINLGLLEDKVIDGKTVRVMGKNIVSPNVLLGMLAQPIESFDTDKTTTDWVKNFGDKKTALYQAANTARAGTITEYLGPEYLSKLKNPVVKGIADKFNESINELVDSKIGGESNSYNLMGVITENLGKYGENNFTYNRAEAEADKNKILVKINQSTHRMDLDPTGPNYKRMKEEATNYVRNQIMLKLDADKKISTTAQSQLQESTETIERVKRKYATKGTGEEAPPVVQGEVLNLETTDKQGKKSVIGVTQRVEGLVFPSGKGIELRIDQLSYNNKNGTLELSGKKISGKEEKGKTTTGTDKVVGKEGETIVKEEPFVKNDINSAPLLSTAILKFRNPEDPNGRNFTSVAQAKQVFRRIFQNRQGNAPASSATNSNKPPVVQNGVTYNWNPTTNQYE